MIRRSLLYILLALLIFPYLFILSQLTDLQWSSEIPNIFVSTILQSCLSTLVVLILGYKGALGLLALKNKSYKKFWVAVCLVPSFLPALFFVLSVLQVVPQFPMGFWGIVIVQTLSALGLCAVLLAAIFRDKLQSISELCYLEGASVSLFARTAIQNLKMEFVLIFLFFFVQFFTSLSIPLLVGEGFQTVETFVYKQVFISGSLSTSFMMSLIEMAMVLLLLCLYKPQGQAARSRSNEFYLLKNKLGLVILAIPTAIYIYGNISSIVNLVRNRDLVFIPPDILELIYRSTVISLLVGFLLMCLFMILIWNFDSKKISKFLFGYISLSTVFIGICFLLLKIKYNVSADVGVVLALTIFFFPMLYRFGFKEKLDSLQRQITVAQLMGASSRLIFLEILMPQMASVLFFLCGLGAFWAIGDFALMKLIYGQEKTLSIFIQNLTGQYRIELALFYEIILLLCGGAVFYFFNGLKYVFDPKSEN